MIKLPRIKLPRTSMLTWPPRQVSTPFGIRGEWSMEIDLTNSPTTLRITTTAKEMKYRAATILESEMEIDLTNSPTTLRINPMNQAEGKNGTRSSTDPDVKKSPCRICLTIAAYNTLLFVCLFGSSFALFVTSDIFLTTEISRSGATQMKWDSRWWSLLPLHFLFYIALMLSCLMLTLRCGHQNNRSNPSTSMLLCNIKTGNQKTEQNMLRIILTVLFLVLSATTLYVPNVLQRAMAQEDRAVGRGNCTNSLDIQNNGGELCSFLSANPHYFQLRSDIPFQSNEMSGSATVEREVNIKTTMLFLQKLDEYLPVMRLFQLDTKYAHLKKMLDAECFNEMFDVVCLMFTIPCQYSDCTIDRFDEPCHYRWLHSMVQCGKNQCRSNQGCDAELEFSHEKVSEFFTQVFFLLDEVYVDSLEGIIRPHEQDMVLWVFEELMNLTTTFSNTTLHNSTERCGMKWWQDSATRENTVNANETSCNPKIKTYRAPGRRIYYDGSVGLACMATFVLIVLVCQGRMPTVRKPGVVRVVSILLGLLLTSLVFVGGVNVERASFDENVKEDLLFWSSLYYVVAFVCFHHSIEIWFQDSSRKPSRKPSTMTAESTATNSGKERSNSLMFTTTVSFKNRIMKDVISSRGKYYFLRFYAKEVLEVFFQLAGVINSQTETDAFPAFFTAFFVGLNLILVPLVYNVAMQFSGPTLATGLAVFMESLFDKGFIILAVLVRSTSTTISGRNVAEKLLRHGLTLIPAISFALNKSSYITLANQYKAHTLEQKNTESKAHTLGRKSTTKPAEKEQNQQRATSSKRRSSNRRQSFIDMKETNKVTFYFNKIIGAISIFLGLVLTSIVSYRYAYITNHCRQKLGPIFDCATPKYYFRNGLLNGELTCAEDQYISINCTNGELKGIRHIQETDMYKNMKNLSSISIANNDLLSVPTSFAYLPKLIFLNVSGNTRMSKLPYALCASSTLEKEMDLKGTQIAKELDWSGEVLKHTNTAFSIHSGCLRALENTLTKISLANNKLSCPSDDACLFGQVEGLRKLTYLNLRNNTIAVFGMAMVQKTKHILSANASGGISLENNPIHQISLSAMTETLVNSCMQVSNSISDALQVRKVEIKLCTIAESTIIEYNLKRFASMTFLDLRGNKCSNVGLVLNSFPTTLEHLNLGANYFQTLEGTPFLDHGFPSLRHVGFAGQITDLGRLSVVEPGFFSGLGNVIVLELQWADFDLQSKGFIGLGKVEKIDLKDSDIGIIYENAFVGLPELITLDLSNTRVKEYRLGCFNGTNIQTLTVEITFKDGNLDPKLFDSMPSLRTLRISRSGSGLTGTQPKINMTNVFEIDRQHTDVNVEVYDCDDL